MGRGNKHITPLRYKKYQKKQRELLEDLSPDRSYSGATDIQLDSHTDGTLFHLKLLRDQYLGDLEETPYFKSPAIIGVNNGKTQILRDMKPGDWYFVTTEYASRHWMQVQVRINTLNKRTFVCGKRQGVWLILKGCHPETGLCGGVVMCLEKRQGELKPRGPRQYQDGTARW